MDSLSVVVDSVGNNECFINKLLMEIGDELTADVAENMIEFHNIDDGKSDILCDGLAKAIIQAYEKKMLVKAVNKICRDFPKPEKMQIWKIAMKQLLNDNAEKNQEYYNRLYSVKQSVNNYLKESEILSLEGFVNFRLADYAEELEDVADISAREYSVELEYKEFIEMLKYFLSVQIPRYLSVEIVYGKSVLIYADGKNVTEECIREYVEEIGTDARNKDDFVLNSLIIIAPKRVKLSITDGQPEQELLDTVKGVFGDRAVVSLGK